MKKEDEKNQNRNDRRIDAIFPLHQPWKKEKHGKKKSN